MIKINILIMDDLPLNFTAALQWPTREGGDGGDNLIISFFQGPPGRAGSLTFFEKIYSNRLQVHRFRGSELTENPPAIRRAGLNHRYVSAEYRRHENRTI